MQRGSQLTLVFAGLLLQAASGDHLVGIMAQEPPVAKLADADLKHGNPEILNSKLIRVRELEGHLRAVAVDGEGRLPDAATRALSQIFAHPFDVLSVESGTGKSRSIRARSLQFLRESSAAAQRDWIQSTAVLAESRLRNALRNSDRRSLDTVARQFPLTEPGITAAVLSMTMDFLQGGQEDIAERLAILEEDCSGTVLQNFLQEQSRRLRERLEAGLVQQARDAAVSGQQIAQLSIPTAAETGPVAPPWPQAKWKWQESVWKYPGAPQPEAGNALESFVPETETSLNEFNNWRVVFWGDSIVLRSPFRLVAFDRQSGRPRWSLPTNTYTPENESAENKLDTIDELSGGFAARSPESASIGGMASFGLLSSDDEFLYFVDQFDFFRRDSQSEAYRFQGRNRIPGRFGVLNEEEEEPRRIASTLVALRKSPHGGAPEIAWIAGEQHGFRYLAEGPDAVNPAQRIAREPGVASDQKSRNHPDAGVNSKPNSKSNSKSKAKPNAERRAGESEHSPERLVGHRFLCPPVGAGQRLFVLSVRNDQFWMNCLMRGNGRLLWQQPLIFSDEQMSRIWDSWNQANGTSVCLLSGDTVVCSLAEGILVGVRAIDGQLSWATAVRDEPALQPSRGFRFALPDDVEMIDTNTVLVPLASDSVVVCTSNPSSSIYGIDTRNGEILWRSARRAFGPGDVGGSPDHYIAGISDTQVILVGERHCRSLNLKTGDQNWVTGISRTSGRAECRGDRCLIPRNDGHVMTVNLKDGSLLPHQQSYFPENAVSVFGAISSDNDVLCASTPVSLVVFPRVDTMLNAASPDRELTASNAEQILTRIRALLINGDSDAAFSVLKGAASDASVDETLREPFERYLGDLVLQDWGEQFLRSLERSEEAPFFKISTSDQARLLADLNLSSAQQLRAAVLVLLSRQGADASQETLQELAEFREWTTPMFITDNWSVRPDLLLRRSAEDPESEMASLAKLTPFRLQQLAADGALFPEMFASDSRRQQFVNRLITSGEYAAAEIFLGAWINSLDPSSELASLPKSVLQQLRERDVIAGYVLSEVREHFRPADAPDSADPAKGLSSATTAPLGFEFQPLLRTPSWERQMVDKGLAMSVLPEGSRRKYFLVDGRDRLPDLVSMDMSDGSLRDRVAMPFPFYQNGVGFRPVGTSSVTPSLLPIAGADQLAMVSCTVPEKAGLLWTRRYRGDESENSRLEFGALGPDHFVWHFGDQLHCTHPLTGRDLWTQRLALSHNDELFSGVRRIFGDRSVTVVMGSDNSSLERFSTRDGRRLGSGRLDFGRVTDPETIGRCLLYPDRSGLLHLFDGATGKDELADDEPIRLGPYNTRHAFKVLAEGRVATVSSGGDIILIDTNQGRVIFRVPAKEHIRQVDGMRFVFGLTAFERNGYLFVGLDDEKDENGIPMNGGFRDSEPRIDSGPLLCMDPVNGEILWSTRLTNVVIPPVYGDPTDLLVTLSHKWGDDDPRGTTGDVVDIQLLNGLTGEVMARSSPLSASRPVRCIHMASTSTMQIVTKDSVISIRTESQPSEAP